MVDVIDGGLGYNTELWKYKNKNYTLPIWLYLTCKWISFNFSNSAVFDSIDSVKYIIISWYTSMYLITACEVNSEIYFPKG